MTKEESLALFAQGRDAWNAWAAEKTAERDALEAAGTWVKSSDEAEWNDETRAWHASVSADFSKHTFEEDADFRGFVFPGHAGFSGATFTGHAGFDGATFSGDAEFDGATFSGYARFGDAIFTGTAWFNDATFTGAAWFGDATFTGVAWFTDATFTDVAWFGDATFTGNAWFGGATFTGNAWFTQTVFEGFTSFDGARFKTTAGFRAIEGKTVFSLAGAEFEAVPDFIQAHFAEAPRLDDLRIEPGRFWPPTPARVKAYFKGDPDLAARWRALKRIAIQGHDHARELAFFKGELKARRWTKGSVWLTVVSYPYEWLSDFGDSMVRPLAWLAVSVVLFAGVYLDHRVDVPGQPNSVVAGDLEQPKPLGGDASAPPRVERSCDATEAAFGLSLGRALWFVAFASRDRLDDFRACLYGRKAEAASPPARSAPDTRSVSSCSVSCSTSYRPCWSSCSSWPSGTTSGSNEATRATNRPPPSHPGKRRTALIRDLVAGVEI